MGLLSGCFRCSITLSFFLEGRFAPTEDALHLKVKKRNKTGKVFECALVTLFDT